MVPVVLFVYNRPDHLRRTLENLKFCQGVEDTMLYVFADGPKPGTTDFERTLIKDVRLQIESIDFCQKVILQTSEVNKGLATSVIKGVSEVLSKHESCIVLEDDILVNTFFLTFMNRALSLCKDVDDIWGVSGFTFLNYDAGVPDYFLLERSSSWGWATWKRVWDQLNFNSTDLLNAVQEKFRTKSFDFGGEPFYQMLKDQKTGVIDSWAIRFYANLRLQKAKFIFPRKTLVSNIGFDESATHTTFSKKFNDSGSDFNPQLSDAPEFSRVIQAKVESDLKKLNRKPGLIQRAKNRFFSYKSS